MVRDLVLVILFLLVAGCTKTYNNEELLLEWRDKSAEITFRVTRHPSLVKQNNEFYVEHSGRVQAELIDDDAVFGQITFVKYENWLLVLSNNEVWAGFNYDSKAICGEYDCEKLPFTVRKSAGTVVATRTISDHSASPANFPRIPETSPSATPKPAATFQNHSVMPAIAGMDFPAQDQR